VTSYIQWPPEAELMARRIERLLRVQAKSYDLPESDIQVCMNDVLMSRDMEILAAHGSMPQLREIAYVTLMGRLNELQQQARQRWAVA
jgi:hypothetical protein